MDREVARSKLFEQLGKITAVKEIPITEDTEVYYDLRISGLDLLDLFRWLESEFGVQVAVRLSDYTPSEGWDPYFFRKWRLRRRPYKSLTPRDLLKGIEAGVWPGQGSNQQ